MQKAAKVPMMGERVGAKLLLEHEILADDAGRGSNAARHLFDVFYWQEAADKAALELGKAWDAAQGEDGPIDADDDLRALGEGEHIVAESDRFSCLVTVQGPRLNFDRDLFITSLCKSFKLKRDAVEKIAEACRAPTRAPLRKRVVEA